MPPAPPLVILSGPTASGKSGLALALAAQFPFEIVNADSLQVYRGMDIGSAKPTPEERVQVPHHLVDVADPDEPYNAGRFVAEADAAILEIRGRDRWPMVVGGTGMYIRALLRGLDALPADPEVRETLSARWEAEGGTALHAELHAKDPASAGRIHPADRVRVIRALEIAIVAGKPASVLRAAWEGREARYTSFFMALKPDRDRLYARIDARVDEMFRRGLLDEVRGLLARGYGPALKPMGALGYRHAVSHLVGGVPLVQAVEAMKRDTRHYAKRQSTWLAAEREVAWIPGEGALGAASDRIKYCLF
ncbi:MAG TPA: tRNA (adenosine(37)-N6)-dimethylallyltransferase MiaA [Candidatus Deferrimicrobiaceae bacterium]|jgi:tRNA dimethylallyltransferase